MKMTLPQTDMFAHYLSYATLVTYVPVLGAVVYQFPSGVVFERFLSEDEQKAKWVSAHLPNSKTLNQNVCYGSHVFWMGYFLFY